MPISAPNDLIAARFYEAAKAGRLSLPLCKACGKHHFYPRSFCPHCWSEELNWVDVSGEASVYSFTVVRDKDPYVLAVVELAEGPRMMTNIIECPPAAVHVGMRVRVNFQPFDGERVPMFSPAGKGQAQGSVVGVS
jgi:uncharacterized protein